MKKFFRLRASSLSLMLMTLLSVPLAVGQLPAQTTFCGSDLGTVIGTQNSSTVTWANNATYSVTGTLTINQNLSLDAVSFQMNPSSSIRILNDATIAKQRADVFGRLSTAADDLSGAQGEAATANLSSLQSVGTYVANLPTTKQYESNLRTVLGIAVRYAQGDSLVTADSTSLRSVAAQCQQYGGTSIRRAPHWLNEAEDIRYIDKNWDTNCTVGARTMVVLTGTNLVLIAPNPADGYLRVLWPVDQGGQWYITDLTGRTVRHDQWLSTESDLVIGTADWQPGLYFLQTRTDAGSTSTVKFIIYH